MKMKKQKVENKIKMQKIQKLLSIPKKQENEDEDNNMLLENIDVDDKLFKKYSHGKYFNSFINEFDHTTNKKDKEKMVQELKEINDMLYHYINRDENCEYRSKLIDIVNAIDYFLFEYSKKWASDFNWKEAIKDYY